MAILVLAGCGLGEIVAPEEETVWGRSAGGSGDDFASGIAVGPDDCMVLAGRLEGTAVFGEGGPDETILTSAGIRDVFVAKYHPYGNLAWVRHAGGDDDDYGRGVAVAPDGSILVTGTFMETATFGAGEAAETTLTSFGGEDVFVAKYQPDGAFAWVRSAGGIDHDRGHEIAVTPDGGAIITGEFQGTATFGAGEVNETDLPFYRARDMFIARYEPDGTLAWVRRAGGDGENVGHAVAAAADGGAFVTGEFRMSAVFGEGDVSETTLNARSAADVFVAKYAADGTLAWAKRAGSSTAADASDDVGWDIAVAADGGVFVTGEFGENAVFGEGESGETSLAATGLSNIFVAKLDAEGQLAWVKHSSGSFSDAGAGVVATEDNGAVITGRFHGSTAFEAGEPNEVVLESAGLFDIVIARFEADGDLVWAIDAGGYTGDDAGNGVAIAADGGVLVTGSFGQRVVFRDDAVGSSTYLQSKGMRDAFLARLPP